MTSGVRLLRAIQGLAVDQPRRNHVLNRQPQRLEQRHLLGRSATLLRSGDDLPDLGEDLPGGDDVPALLECRLPRVHVDSGAAQYLIVELAPVRAGPAYRVDVRPRREPFPE